MPPPPPLPEGHRRIGLNGLNDLTIDDKNNLYWKNEKLKTVLRLSWLQGLIAISVSAFAFLASVASLAESYINLKRIPYTDDCDCGPDEQLPPTASGLYFYTGSAVLRPESIDYLNALEAELLSIPTLSIEIRGYTDNYGSPIQNQRLSEERAGSVAQWLYGRGIARERVRSRGFGASNPIADNSTAEGRAANRRVEIVRFETTPSVAPTGE